METRNWIIIDCRSNSALYGYGRKTLRFSTDKIAYAVGKQFFEKEEDFIVYNIDDIKI
jgi:hypothetical protein